MGGREGIMPTSGAAVMIKRDLGYLEPVQDLP